MSELSFKELQEKGVFNSTSHAFDYMQHQQSKVDELQKQRDSFIKAYEIEIEKSIELQKRVEFLEINLRFVKDHFEMNDLDKAMPRVYEELEQALKGGLNE